MEKNLIRQKGLEPSKALNLKIFPPGEAVLFNLNFSACLFKGSLKLLSLGLGYFLLYSLRSAVHEILSFLQTKTKGFLNGLDNLKFSLTC